MCYTQIRRIRIVESDAIEEGSEDTLGDRQSLSSESLT